MKSVLITGAAQGIGRGTALHLAANGWHVLAGVRREEDGSALVAALAKTELSGGARGSVEPVLLDVTDPLAVGALANVKALDAVVNNAAVMVTGPVEAIDSDTLRQHFEVNVVGARAVTRAVLPVIRCSRGRVVFISSVSGRIATPWMGAYCGSKFAVEALADSLRMELRPWQIGVSIVEPGVTATDLWVSGADVLDTTDIPLSDEHHGLYGRHATGMRRRIRAMAEESVPIDRVVRTIERALTDRTPAPRYVVDASSAARIAAMSVLPTRIADAMLSRMSGIPRRA